MEPRAISNPDAGARADVTPDSLNDLETAIQEYATLATQYHAVAAFNYSRTDLTGLVDRRGLPIMLARVGDPSASGASATASETRFATWVCVNGRENLTAVPLPEKREEHARVGLEQHRLHDRLYEARQRVMQLSEAIR